MPPNRNSEERKQMLAIRRTKQRQAVSNAWYPSPGAKGNKYVPAGEHKNTGKKTWG